MKPSTFLELKSCSLDTIYGHFALHCFSWGSHEDDNVLVLTKDPLTNPCLVRVQSACYTGEIFRSLDCDCHEQLSQSLSRISKIGGAFVYLLRDGRGAGLIPKIAALAMQETENIDTADAYPRLGIPPDPREYSRVAEVLAHFSLSNILLLTNNPRKIDGLKAAGFSVSRAPLEIKSTPHSKQYLHTKATKMGHYLSEFRSQD